MWVNVNTLKNKNTIANHVNKPTAEAADSLSNRSSQPGVHKSRVREEEHTKRLAACLGHDARVTSEPEFCADDARR